ncbi:MAG: response regulator, partial [Bacteroidetes bacterium]|nr:response regulator [Bacteroidota bacterium]
HFLSDEGFTVKVADSGTKAINIVDSFKPDIILMDQNMPGLNGIETMEMIKSRDPLLVVIIITAYGAVPLAVNSIKKGAYDYIEKPFDNDKLLLLLHRAIDHKKLSSKVMVLQDKLDKKYSFDNIIANSDDMQKVLEQVKRVSETDATVLIQGESGVGKELIAQAIHYNSPRKEMPLIAVNCGAIPVQLMESEFFGHEKGAFTDAKETKTGKFEQAHQGTLFLDEIGELPLEAQVKLLRVLEDKKINKIGGKKAIQVDIRIISATNKNLTQKVQEDKFRLDLLYRLNIFTITIPPLRERKDDIPLLIDHFIQKYNTLLKLNIKNITKPAMDLLIQYNWPGNIRDLENAIQSSMILCQDNIITEDNLPIRVYGYSEADSDFETGKESLEDKINQVNSKVEKEIIIKALRKCNNNRTKTANFLKISRKTLFNKMKIYKLFDGYTQSI